MIKDLGLDPVSHYSQPSTLLIRTYDLQISVFTALPQELCDESHLPGDLLVVYRELIQAES